MQVSSAVVSLFFLSTRLLAQDALHLQTAQTQRLSEEASQTFSGTVVVQNLAYEKDVTIHYRSTQDGLQYGTWLAAKAHYDHARDAGHEVWTFVSDALPSQVRGNDFEFYLILTTLGQTFQDHNPEHPYRVGSGYLDSEGHPRFLLAAAPMAVESASYAPRGGGQWLITAWTQPEYDAVEAIYSMDGWKTVLHAEASQAYSIAGKPVWFLRIPGDGQAICFALKAEGENVEAWDNNDGRNHCTSF